MKTILFQGDSITDSYRNYNADDFVGCGYPGLIKGYLGKQYGSEYNVINRGISGNKIIDLLSRMKWDIVQRNPDYLSILIGVNDAINDADWCNEASASAFEKAYSIIIEAVRESLPKTKICILEPFILRGSGTENTEEWPDKWEKIHTYVLRNAAASKRIAEKYGLPFIPLQSLFEEYAERLGTETVSIEGIHPSHTGHLLIAEEWMKMFEKEFKEN